MSIVLDPNATGSENVYRSIQELAKINLGYEYTGGLNLRPGFKLHDKIVSRVLHRAQTSHNYMGRRHMDWQEIDKTLKSYAYVPQAGGLKAKKGTDETGGAASDSRRIIMPVSSVVLDSLLTYATNAFLRSPVFTYEGVGPEDVLGAMLMTEVVQRHVQRNAIPLALHTAWRDMFAYGVGYAVPRWTVLAGRRKKKAPEGVLDKRTKTLYQTGQAVITGEYETIFEGNSLDNIDPYLALPDPNVSAHEVDKGEFFGWVDEDMLFQLLRNEKQIEHKMFNCRYLKEIEGNLTSVIINRGERNKKKQFTDKVSRPVDVIWMMIDLIPRNWGLGRGKDPEVWVFGVAADKILISAYPLDGLHTGLPVVAGAPDFDGYGAAPTSRLLAIEELQMMTDFLYTSHIENIKRVLNNDIVVDPSLINIHDVNDNKPGRVIRALKRAWGQGKLKDNAIFQLDVKDATQQNITEAMFLMEQAKTATGTLDQLLGNLQPRTSRVSASEAQGLRQSGLTRLERPMQLISYQFMQPLARMFALNVQQYMSQEVYIKTVGELEKRLIEDFGMEPQQGRMVVRPMDLVVDYDVQPHDGAIPGKENVDLWVELFQIMGQYPILAQGFDIIRVFKHIARELGARNIDDFIARNKPQVVPDEVAIREAERGNVVPISNGEQI